MKDYRSPTSGDIYTLCSNCQRVTILAGPSPFCGECKQLGLPPSKPKDGSFEEYRYRVERERAYGMTATSKHPGVNIQAGCTCKSCSVNRYVKARANGGSYKEVEVGLSGAEYEVTVAQPKDITAPKIPNHIENWDVTLGDLAIDRLHYVFMAARLSRSRNARTLAGVGLGGASALVWTFVEFPLLAIILACLGFSGAVSAWLVGQEARNYEEKIHTCDVQYAKADLRKTTWENREGQPAALPPASSDASPGATE